MRVQGVEKVVNNLEKFKLNWNTKTKVVMDYTIRDSVNYAMSNAPWTDRTSNARRSIAESNVSPDGKVGHLLIGVDYGKYLELSNEGRYRIIWPTIEQRTKPQLLENIKRFMKV